MNLLWVLGLALLCLELQTCVCQAIKRKKDDGENSKRLGGKRTRTRLSSAGEKKGKNQSLLTQVLEKGRFLRLGQSATLTPGPDMELRCKGPNIGWSYPPILDAFNDSRLSIKHSDKYSQLILASASAADTGSYSCWVTVCDGSECHRDQDRTYTSYIYFTDKDNLFVPSAIHFEIIFLRPDQPAVVPCRVTEPKARASLHREVPPEEIAANGTLVTYEPTRGFVLQHPSPGYQGVFYCKAVSKGNPQVSTKYQLLYVEVPSGPPFVSMEVSTDFVRPGYDVNVSCSVLGDPEVDVDFAWSFPSQSVRVAPVHTSWRLVKRGVGYTTRLSKSILTLLDTQTTDFGDYVCKAKTRFGETVVTTGIRPT